MRPSWTTRCRAQRHADHGDRASQRAVHHQSAGRQRRRRIRRRGLAAVGDERRARCAGSARHRRISICRRRRSGSGMRCSAKKFDNNKNNKGKRNEDVRSHRPRRHRHRRQWRHRARHGHAGLHEAGAAIVVAGRNEDEDRARRSRQLRRAARRRSPSRSTSPTRPRSHAHGRAESSSALGRIDILVNNAGINIRKPPQDYTLAEWRQRDRHQPDQRVPVLAGGLSRT